MTLKMFTCAKLYLTLLCEYFIFPTPYHPHIWCGSWSVCVCVCVCVWLFFSFCFLFSLSYWLSYFCLVTIVLSCQSCLQNVKQNPKNLSLLLYFFLTPPPTTTTTLVITILLLLLHPKIKRIMYFFSQCSRSSMCTKGGRERGGEKQEINSSEANTVPNSQYNINFGWWLDFILFYLVFLAELIYYY